MEKERGWGKRGGFRQKKTDYMHKYAMLKICLHCYSVVLVPYLFGTITVNKQISHLLYSSDVPMYTCFHENPD